MLLARLHSGMPLRCYRSDLPLLRKDWAGMAFDRNLYEDSVPNDVWVAWLSALSSTLQISRCARFDVQSAPTVEALWKLSEG